MGYVNTGLVLAADFANLLCPSIGFSTTPLPGSGFFGGMRLGATAFAFGRIENDAPLTFQTVDGGSNFVGSEVVFIGVHLPSYLKDKGLGPEVAGYALALIGLFNVFGTYGVGLMGSRFSGRQLLTCNYLGRSVVISVFLWVPVSNWSVYIFSGCMGLLWLSTVPPTNGTVAKIFGLSHFSMLTGCHPCVDDGHGVRLWPVEYVA